MKSVIHGMLQYSFLIHVWPVSLIKIVDKWIRSFIWSGDINNKKIDTVALNKVCMPTTEGGLGLRAFEDINDAGSLKLCWEFFLSFSKSSQKQINCFISCQFIYLGRA